jgi:hypothetical protein
MEYLLRQISLGLLDEGDDTGGIILKRRRCTMRLLAGKLKEKRKLLRSKGM